MVENVQAKTTLVYIVLAIVVIGALMWGWAAFTGSLPTFFNEAFTRAVYVVIGIAGIVLVILLGMALYKLSKAGNLKPECWINLCLMR